MSSLEEHGEGTNAEHHLRHAGRPKRQLSRVARLKALPVLSPFNAVPPVRLLEPPPNKQPIADQPGGKHTSQQQRNIARDKRTARKGPRCRFKGSIDDGDVKQEPEREAKELDGGFADAERVDDLPGEVEAEGDEGRWGVACGEGAADHEDVGEEPEGYAG